MDAIYYTEKIYAQQNNSMDEEIIIIIIIVSGSSGVGIGGKNTISKLLCDRKKEHERADERMNEQASDREQMKQTKIASRHCYACLL